ncbi:MAG: hypothetical protein QXW80_05285 [Candidatus Micrarchaeia archaeon]
MLEIKKVICSICVVKFNAIKYELDENGSIIKEECIEVTVTIDREYFNFEADSGKRVYSIKTSEILDFILSNIENEVK